MLYGAPAIVGVTVPVGDLVQVEGMPVPLVAQVRVTAPAYPLSEVKVPVRFSALAGKTTSGELVATLVKSGTMVLTAFELLPGVLSVSSAEAVKVLSVVPAAPAVTLMVKLERAPLPRIGPGQVTVPVTRAQPTVLPA